MTYLYVMTAGELTKIGVSADPTSRRVTLQHDSPTRIEVAAAFSFETMSAAMRAERHCHRQLRAYRLAGSEWFKCEARECIEVAQAAHQKTKPRAMGIDALKMHAPAHPGEILHDLYLEPMGATITAAADALGVSRKHVSAIVNGDAPITVDMAARLGVVLGTGADLWVNLQAQFDIWTLTQKAPPKLKALAAA